MTSAILVFGANGQVARELARTSPPAGFDVVCVGRSEADVTDTESVQRVVERTAPAAVVNAAAYTAVDAAEDDADAAFAVNAEGAGHVARSAARLGVPCLHVSTDYVFDGRSDEAYTPSDPVRPLGVYGRSKEAGERAVRAAGPNHLILRTAWVYSPFGHNFVRTMLRVGAERDELTVVDDQIGNPTAAHAIAEALLTASSAMTRSPDPALRGTFHFTGRGSVSWCGFARAIFRQAQAEGCSAAPTVTAITSDQWPTRAPRPGNSRLDSSAFQVAFGYEAKPWPEDLATVLAQLSDDMGTAGRRRQ